MRIVPDDEAKVRVGDRFTKLVVIGPEFRSGKSRSVVCECDCGGVVAVQANALLRGATTSCKCIQRAVHSARMRRTGSQHPSYKHGWGSRGSDTEALIKCWWAMLDRCENDRNASYHRYGGRGISVCKEWSDSATFCEWATANGWKKGLTLDRIDNDGNYEPVNCRWVTQKVQGRNTSRTTFVVVEGVRVPLVEVYEKRGSCVPYKTFLARVKRLGWTIEDAIQTPIGAKHEAQATNP